MSKKKARNFTKTYYPQASPEVASLKDDNIMQTFFDDYKKSRNIVKSEKMLGTAIPYIFSIIGQILANPSTVSPSTFKKMIDTDDVMGRCSRYNIDCIINSIGLYTHPVPEIQDAGRLFIKNYKRGWSTFLRDILLGIYLGFSIQESVINPFDPNMGYVTFTSLPLPQNTIVFKGTPQGELQEDGVGQYVFNTFYPGISSMLSYGLGNIFGPILPGNQQYANYGEADPYAAEGDLDYPFRSSFISPVGLVWLPLDKIIRYCYYNVTNNQNPYGKSAARDLYTMWVAKYALIQFILRAAKTKSSPLLAVFGAANVPVGDYDVNDEQSLNNYTPSNTIANLKTLLDSYDSASALVFPGLPGELFDFKTVPNEANIDMLLDLLKYIDESIEKSMMVPRTAFGGGGDSSGGYSLSQTHEGVHKRWVMSVREDLIQNTLIPQVMKRFIELNFIESEHKDVWGDFQLGLISLDDQMKQVDIFTKGITAGIIDRNNLNDLNQMREVIKFDKLDKVFQLIDSQTQNGDNTLASGVLSDRELKDSTNDAYAHSK